MYIYNNIYIYIIILRIIKYQIIGENVNGHGDSHANLTRKGFDGYVYFVYYFSGNFRW